MAASVYFYKGLKLTDPHPNKDGGELIIDNFKYIADNLSLLNNDYVSKSNVEQHIDGRKVFLNLGVNYIEAGKILTVDVNGKIIDGGQFVSNIIDNTSYINSISASLDGRVTYLEDTQITKSESIDISGYLQYQIDSIVLSGGVSNFLQLTDSPNSYIGQGGKAVLVKNDASGLEFSYAQDPYLRAELQPITASLDSRLYNIENTYITEVEVSQISGYLQNQISSIPLSTYTLRTETADVSGYLLNQINSIEQESTDIIGGNGIQVIESPINTFTISVSGDYPTNSQVAELTGNLQQQINNISQESTDIIGGNGISVSEITPQTFSIAVSANYIKGSLASTQLAFANLSNEIAGDYNLTYNLETSVGGLTIANTTPSNSVNNGALKVLGGAAIGGAVTVGLSATIGENLTVGNVFQDSTGNITSNSYSGKSVESISGSFENLSISDTVWNYNKWKLKQEIPGDLVISQDLSGSQNLEIARFLSKNRLLRYEENFDGLHAWGNNISALPNRGLYNWAYSGNVSLNSINSLLVSASSFSNGLYNAGPYGSTKRALGAYWTNTGVYGRYTVNFNLPNASNVDLDLDFFGAFFRFYYGESGGNNSWSALTAFIDGNSSDNGICWFTSLSITGSSQARIWYDVDSSPAKTHLNKRFDNVSAGEHTLTLVFCDGTGAGAAPRPTIPSGFSAYNQQRLVNAAIDNVKLSVVPIRYGGFETDDIYVKSLTPANSGNLVSWIDGGKLVDSGIPGASLITNTTVQSISAYLQNQIDDTVKGSISTNLVAFGNMLNEISGSSNLVYYPDTTLGGIRINNTTPSNDIYSGAMIISGGVVIGNNLNVVGNINTNNIITIRNSNIVNSTTFGTSASTVLLDSTNKDIAEWLIKIKNGTNIRASKVVSASNGISASYNQYDTVDIGNTTTVTVDVSSLSGNMILYANITDSNTWEFSTTRIDL